MAERVAAIVKTPETKQICSNPCKQNPCLGLNSSEPFANRILQLQRTAGNQAVQKLIQSRALQAKLRISQPNDIYEQEADMVAEQVMRMPKPIMQRQTLRVTPLVQRQVAEEDTLQAKETIGQSPTVTPSIESRISELQGGGQPLDPAIRAFFEPRFGQDFSGVRVHTDTKAAEVARAVNARAFTVGKDVMFGAGQFETGTSSRNHLLAHELVHSIQQGQKLTLIQRILPDQPLTEKSSFLPSEPLEQEPSEQEPDPSQQHASYEQKLKEGAYRLQGVKFGRAESNLFIFDSFDEDFWEKQKDKNKEFKYKLVLKSGKYPSKAVDAIFDPGKKNRWNFDCAQFNQVVHWYALRHAYGATKFNKIIGKDFELRLHGSSGIKTKEEYLRSSPTEPMRRLSDRQIEPMSVDDLLAAAPIGSRVSWTNLAAKPTDPFRNENSFKLGPDNFFGHPYNELSRKELEKNLASETKKNPDEKYIQENIFVSEIEYYDSP